MKIDYIKKIKANISIYASKKTSNILDGEYKSIYKGRSLDFDDLREYVIGDDIKYIDWKSSARSGKTLIRRYIAEKKHNILFVLDTGKKMLGDTKKIEPKKELAIMTMGTLAYLVNNHGDMIGSMYNTYKGLQYYPLKTGIQNIQKMIYHYESDIDKDTGRNLNDILIHISQYMKRKMIIFIITDIVGIENIQEDVLKKLTIQNDVMVINISDADITGNKGYDMDNESYIPEIILKDIKIHNIEEKIKNQLYEVSFKKFKKYKISMVTIDEEKEIVNKIIELLERHKNANIR